MSLGAHNIHGMDVPMAAIDPTTCFVLCGYISLQFVLVSPKELTSRLAPNQSSKRIMSQSEYVPEPFYHHSHTGERYSSQERSRDVFHWDPSQQESGVLPFAHQLPDDSGAAAAYAYDADYQDDPSVERQQPYSRHNDDHSSNSSDDDISRETVIERIEDIILTQSILEPLAAKLVPIVRHPHKSFLHNTHCRGLTSMFLVADFCHELLLSHRTTTIREVYYHFVTHFRNQAECDKAIWDLAAALRVPRSALGLAASPKGWCCGCLELYDTQTGELMWNGRVLDVHGMAITMPLLQHATVRSEDARCILVIEKEGVYTRLSEDKFFQYYYPCILVTGKGFPDIATRQWVQHLQRVLNLPAFALCDGNPYGISVLHTYQYDQKAGVAYGSSQGRRSRTKSPLHLKWLGLRPSQLEKLSLPPSVFQQLTDMDKKRLDSLMSESHEFHQQGNSDLRLKELEDMANGGRKVELEALNWLGLDFLCQWVKNILEQYDEDVAKGYGDDVSTAII